MIIGELLYLHFWLIINVLIVVNTDLNAPGSYLVCVIFYIILIQWFSKCVSKPELLVSLLVRGRGVSDLAPLGSWRGGKSQQDLCGQLTAQALLSLSTPKEKAGSQKTRNPLLSAFRSLGTPCSLLGQAGYCWFGSWKRMERSTSPPNSEQKVCSEFGRIYCFIHEAPTQNRMRALTCGCPGKLGK